MMKGKILILNQKVRVMKKKRVGTPADVNLFFIVQRETKSSSAARNRSLHADAFMFAGKKSPQFIKPIP